MARPRQVLSNISNISAPLGAPLKEASALHPISDHPLELAPVPLDDHLQEDQVTTPSAGLAIPYYDVPAAELVEDIDLEDIDNPFTCSVYAQDVYKYLQMLQVCYHSLLSFICYISPFPTHFSTFYRIVKIIRLSSVPSQIT
jgi:hypothetical protein